MHGIDFVAASEVFKDSERTETVDDRYDYDVERLKITIQNQLRKIANKSCFRKAARARVKQTAPGSAFY